MNKDVKRVEVQDYIDNGGDGAPRVYHYDSLEEMCLDMGVSIDNYEYELFNRYCIVEMVYDE